VLIFFSTFYFQMLNKEFEDTMKDPAEYSRGELLKENYFLRYERDETLGWYFHPVHTWLAGLNDYQKLVLVNHVSACHVCKFTNLIGFNKNSCK
jgi:hypothetical protein